MDELNKLLQELQFQAQVQVQVIRVQCQSGAKLENWSKIRRFFRFLKNLGNLKVQFFKVFYIVFFYHLLWNLLQYIIFCVASTSRGQRPARACALGQSASHA